MVTPARRNDATLQRLRLLGLVAPVAFVALLFAVGPLLFDSIGNHAGHAAVAATLILSSLIFGLAMFFLLHNAHTRAVEAERRMSALEERERIARELHDSLAQVLGVAHLRLHALSGRAAVASDEKVRGEVLELADLCHEAYRDVREAIFGLRDAARTDRTLLDQLDAYVATYSRTSTIPTTLHADEARDLALSPAAEVQVIRVIQEALTNVRKHSGARTAKVSVSAHPEHLEFVISDDGRGFNPEHIHADGFGLSTMRERTTSVGGRFALHSTPGRGTQVVVQLPRRDGARIPEEVGA